ncbi:flagellar hook protein FlgE [Acidithiobacillus ferrivorans]|nr:flagellar hook protein FlgE [Acidithiobacillus ferrivorans]
MSYNTALSGLDAAQTNLNTIGNNIANVNTVGFKSSNAQFADMYAASLAGSAGANTTPGMGVATAALSQNFSEGSLQTTSNPNDLAISGPGFFIVNSNNGTPAYTRNGQFSLSSGGILENNAGLAVQGYAVSSQASGTSGATFLNSTSNIIVNESNMAPKQTSQANLVYNLDSSTNAGYAPTVQVFDSLGNSHTLSETFSSGSTSTSTTGTTVIVHISSGTGNSSGLVLTGTLLFSTTGQLVSGTFSSGTGGASSDSGVASGINWGNGSASGTANLVTFNFSGTTYTNSPNGVVSENVNGYAPGSYNGIGVSSNGIIQAKYSNGQTQAVGRLALANFTNLQGLTPEGGNLWTATTQSGPALVNAPGVAGVGVINASTIEASNVNLSAQLVNMIVAQQAYQANTQTIKIEQQDTQAILVL